MRCNKNLPFTIALILVMSVPLWGTEEPMSRFQMPKVELPTIPERAVNVTDFGAVPDGKTLNTETIAKAIAALAEQGGGRLIFPAGMWLTGPIGLKSKIELRLRKAH